MYEPALAEEPPTLAFPSDGSRTPPWSATAGASFQLLLRVRSAGKAGEGVCVVASGPAVEEGYVSFTSLRIDDHHSEFRPKTPSGAQEAMLSGCPIPAGYVHPLNPRPKNPRQKAEAAELISQTHFDLVLEGQAAKSGQPLLRLAIGALETEPVRWMRPISIDG